MQFAGLEGTGYPMELFGNPNSGGYYTDVPASTNTMEMCCPLHDLGKLLPLVLKELDDFPAPTAIDVRFTKSSDATLAPSKWGTDISAWISLSSLDSLAARASYERIYEILAASENIEFTYHWGKGLPRNAEWAGKSFGDDLEKWKTLRKNLLTTPEARYVFSSAFTDLIGVTAE
jgi:D-arabinono-1,4-lactone oxidase